MSLQVWLPLNGNLDNQGLYNTDISSLGTIGYDSAGKIGSAFISGGTTQVTNGVSLNSNFLDILQTKKTASVAVWIKPLGNHFHYNGTIFSSGDWNKKRWAFGVSQYNTKVDVFCNGHNVYVTCAVPVNEWTHLVSVYNDRVCTLYKNGEYVATYTATSDFDSDATNSCIGRETYANGYFGFNGLINDFRFYDHCLSAKEVKEISKGLVLHYKLDDPYIEGTTNLVTTQDGLSSTCYNGSTNKYGYGTSTDIYKEVTTFDGKIGTKVYMGTDGLTANPYVFFSNIFTSNGTNAPAYKTLSFDFYGTRGEWLNVYKLGNGSGTCTWINKSTGQSGTYTNSSNSILVTPNQWNHLELTLHGTTDANAEWGYCILGGAHTSSTNNFWFFANIQVEEKDHATAYAGVGGTRAAGTKVYDSSGYGRDGTPTNILIDSSTPRFSQSVKLNGSSSYIKTEDTSWMVDRMPEITINFWAKCSNWANTSRMFSCTEDGGFNIEAGNSGYYRFPVMAYNASTGTSREYKYDSQEIQLSALSTTKWVMITCIYDSTGVKTYIDGQLHHTHTFTSYGIRYATAAKFFLGCESNNGSPSSPYFNGQLSDFRMYATALSAADVKELYDTSVSIDKSGNVYAREVKEI